MGVDGETDRILSALHGLAQRQVRLDRRISDRTDARHHGLEIVLRYFFNSPSQWAYEISLFVFGAYIVLGGAYTHLSGGHVNVDIIWCKLSPRGRAIVDIVTSGFAFLFLGVLFWTSLQITINSWQIGETTMSHWKPIYYPLRTTVPVACFLFLMQVLAKLIRDVAIAIKGEDVFPVKVPIPGMGPAASSNL
jgi:TRAP-type mannitol/chloroaromatic compound transport system permease small subunit